MGDAARAFFPGRPPIDAYGNGGFRFAGMSHRGALLLLPSGVYGWSVERVDGGSIEAFDPVFAEAEQIGFLLLGTGMTQVFPDKPVRDRFAAAGIGLDSMSTGAAVRTYNVLLAERRAVAAALIAVDRPR